MTRQTMGYDPHLTGARLFADWQGEIRLRRGAAVPARDLWRGQDLKAGQTLHLRLPAAEVAIPDLRLATPARGGRSSR